MIHQNEERKILFLMKTMKAKHVDNTMKKGQFCFNHPSVFNRWENTYSAQSDIWDGHGSIIAENLVYAPILQDDEDAYICGEIKPLVDKANVHFQTNITKNTPVCCFRMIEENEVVFNHEMRTMNFSLGKTADRIINEFGHDSYILIHRASFIERLKKQNRFISRAVTYKDIVRLGEISLTSPDVQYKEEFQELSEQLFRKDKRFEWQKEYRIALTPPTEKNPVFVEIGSIEDIAVSGKIADLRN